MQEMLVTVPHMPLAGSQAASALARGETGMGLQSEMPGAEDLISPLHWHGVVVRAALV